MSGLRKCQEILFTPARTSRLDIVLFPVSRIIWRYLFHRGSSVPVRVRSNPGAVWEDGGKEEEDWEEMERGCAGHCERSPCGVYMARAHSRTTTSCTALTTTEPLGRRARAHTGRHLGRATLYTIIQQRLKLGDFFRHLPTTQPCWTVTILIGWQYGRPINIPPLMQYWLHRPSVLVWTELAVKIIL